MEILESKLSKFTIPYLFRDNPNGVRVAFDLLRGIRGGVKGGSVY
jgi:hypothetical protein